ncbi:proline dehydrogenase [Thermotomaculum hydrothermale]|uniref:Proline dehydrogenase n=1 Tax=Thermotomaculum hydrothermale TaxID=981385 RepID=A0A7R6SZD9_9BACT|nr:proline dehydrogenase family protein [Thermotomaculum hydrothermale]BBB33640.1 proline dehydrogenase [Thermotomaculum hydrothermale]
MSIRNIIVNLMPSPLVKVFARPYVAGQGIDAGINTAKKLWEEKKLHSTIDLLGEEIKEKEEIENNVQIYFNLLDKLGKQEFASVSLKPTQLGVYREGGKIYGVDYCYENIEKIIKKAKGYGIHITIDMEDHPFTDLTLDMFKSLRNKYDNVGTVLQSRLFRTKQDILNLPTDKMCKIRTCIGIYKEPPEVALQDKRQMKEKLFEYMVLLLERGHYPEIATHDEKLIERCIEYLDKNNVPKDRYEFQMLMGVPREKIQRKIVERGNVMRLYVPFAEKWKYAIAYCKRRLAANPMMGAYVIKNLFGKTTGR